MFVEPGLVTHVLPLVSHGCPTCELHCITLVLMDDTEIKEYTVLMCERVTKSYLMDLYTLHVEMPVIETTNDLIQSVTTLHVPRVIDPKEWLHGIRWTRYRKYGMEDHSLEWFIRRGPNTSGHYYSVGSDGTTLIPRDSRMSNLSVHSATVKAVSGLGYCKHPTLEVLGTAC